MNYDFYRTFVILAETKNFSKTAEKMHVVQSTVSNRIQELEKYLGVELCSRTNKVVTLTQAGMHFLPYAKRVVAIEEESFSMLNDLSYKGLLKIGAVHSLYSGYIKKAAKDFMKRRPDIALEIIISHTPDLLEMLSDNLIDIGFVSALPKSNKFVCVSSVQDEIILVAENTSEFKDKICMEDLKTLPLLYADTGDGFISYIQDQIRTKLIFKLKIDQIAEIVEYLREGFGYAFVQRSMVASAVLKGHLKEVSISNVPPCIQEGYVVMERNCAKKDLVDLFVRNLSSVCGERSQV